MPRLIEPPSLRKASLKSIARHYSYLCVDQPASQSGFVSPFRDLSDDMTQELIPLLFGTPGFEPCDIQYLFHHNLRHLNLGGYTRITDSCIRILSSRCPKLTHLNLYDLRTLQPATLCELVSSLPQLISLQLESTRTDGSVLQAIAENCPKLLDLNVDGCHGLKDKDFLLLCNQPEPSRILPQLIQLTSARIYSVDTVVALLNSHRNLRCLGECRLIYQAFDQMYGTEYKLKKEFHQTWVHNLSEVNIYDTEVGILDLQLTTLCCPHLTRLSLDLCKRPLHSLRAVSKLMSLKVLEIVANQLDMGSHVLKDVFQTEVVPILERIGGNLTGLRFRNIGEVCVFRIGELCPNLQSLELKVRFNSSIYNPTAGPYFRQLRVFEICYGHHENKAIPTKALSLILENAREMNRLVFHCVNNITDSIISEANKKHGFRFLTQAFFRKCSLITKETGMILLSPDNPLEYLSFDTCPRLTIQDDYDLQKYAEHRKVTIFNLDDGD